MAKWHGWCAWVAALAVAVGMRIADLPAGEAPLPEQLQSIVELLRKHRAWA